MKVSDIEIGKTYEVAFPFVRDTYDAYDVSEDGVSSYKAPTWRPGVDYEMCAPDDTEAVADGVGKMLLTVVSVHRLPKPYAARVFFVREWINPEGKRFGKKQLRIMGAAAFIHRASGYWLEYRMRELETSSV